MLSPEDTHKLIDGFMAALLERSFHDIALRDIASQADLPLNKVLMQISSKLDLLQAYTDRIDELVLEDDDPEIADEPVRERLFDVLMRRYDAMLPDKLSLVQLERDARRDPALGLALVRMVSISMRRMALAADIDIDGLKGTAVLAGLMQLHGRVLQVWLREEDAGQAKTMAELDQALRQAEDRVGDVETTLSVLRGETSPFSSGLPKLNPLICLRDVARRSTRNDVADQSARAV